MSVLRGVRRATGRTETPWSPYIDDPVGFVEDVLGVTVWERQREMLEIPLKSNRGAIRAGRKVSKSMSLVALALWWAAAHKGKVFMTSTSFPQVKGILWAEMRTVVNRSGLPIHIPLDPMTGVHFPGGGLIVGRTADVRENMQGFSGADALYLVDEASGISREIMEAIDGNTAGGGTIIMAGNPTRLSGVFYDAFHASRSEWLGVRVSSRESPNVVSREIVIPGLATYEWVALQDEKHGSDSPYVAVHVDGEFPGSGSNSVIPLSLAQHAEERWQAVEPEGALHLGVDPARSGGDETVVFPRRGFKALPAISGRNTDTHAIVDIVLTAVDIHARKDEKPVVKVDVIGLGAGVYDVLKRDHGSRLDVRAVNVAEAATANPKSGGGYRKLRDQLWFGLREWLAEGGAYPPDEQTRGDLIAPTFRFDAQGRYIVSSKEELREAVGRSPDRADALALSVYTPPPPKLTRPEVADRLYR